MRKSESGGGEVDGDTGERERGGGEDASLCQLQIIVTKRLHITR